MLLGFFEMTVGTQSVSGMKGIPLDQACVLCTAIISWGGLSVQAQSISFIAGTDLRISRYFLAKGTHMFFAGLWAILFSRLLLNESISAWSRTGELWQQGQNHFLYHFLFSSGMLILVFVAFCALAMLSAVINEEKTEAAQLRRQQKKKWKQAQRSREEAAAKKHQEEKAQRKATKCKEKKARQEEKRKDREENRQRKLEKSSKGESERKKHRPKKEKKQEM